MERPSRTGPDPRTAVGLPGVERCDGAGSLIGQVLQGRYRVLEHVGTGGMGDVYRGVQVPFEREVAIKVLASQHSSNKELVNRFVAEALIISKLRHPNTLKPYDFGRTPDGRLYIVAELVRGESLAEMLDRDRPEPLRVLRILGQVCDSLAEAHSRGIVHRDLKPANVYVDRIGDQDIVKVLDFGVAKVIEGVSHTISGNVCGTPAYMSPEQASGEALDARSDLYSLGVIAYRALSGVLPFEGQSAITVMLQHVNNPPPPFSSLDPPRRFHPELEALVFELLEKDRRLRPGGAGEVRRRIERVSQALLSLDAEGDPATPAASPAARRTLSPARGFGDATPTGTMRLPGGGVGGEGPGAPRGVRLVIVVGVLEALLGLAGAAYVAWRAGLFGS